MSKRAEKLITIVYCSLGILATILALYGAFHVPDPIVIEEIDFQPVEIIESAQTGAEEITIEEDPQEEELSIEAIYSSIGTARESEIFSFNFSRFCESVYQEAGGNSDKLIYAIATCAVNSVKNEGCRITYEDVIEMYQWAKPNGECSQRVIDICFDVLVIGNLLDEVGNSTMFYNPTICGENLEHEVQEYVTTIEDVRFFVKVN